MPLRERFPDYLTIFAIGLGIGTGTGIVISLVSGGGMGTSIGYTMFLIGAGFMLAGGVSGSGLHAGGFGSVFMPIERRRATGRAHSGGNGQQHPEPAEGTAPDKVRSIMEKRLRKAPNPRAFWATVGGVGYLVIGLVLASVR